jgi:hypothetical protein
MRGVSSLPPPAARADPDKKSPVGPRGDGQDLVGLSARRGEGRGVLLVANNTIYGLINVQALHYGGDLVAEEGEARSRRTTDARRAASRQRLVFNNRRR